MTIIIIYTLWFQIFIIIKTDSSFSVIDLFKLNTAFICFMYKNLTRNCLKKVFHCLKTSLKVWYGGWSILAVELILNLPTSLYFSCLSLSHHHLSSKQLQKLSNCSHNSWTLAPVIHSLQCSCSDLKKYKSNNNISLLRTCSVSLLPLNLQHHFYPSIPF